jgi:hypothetical protein
VLKLIVCIGLAAVASTGTSRIMLWPVTVAKSFRIEYS